MVFLILSISFLTVDSIIVLMIFLLSEKKTRLSSTVGDSIVEKNLISYSLSKGTSEDRNLSGTNFQ